MRRTEPGANRSIGPTDAANGPSRSVEPCPVELCPSSYARRATSARAAWSRSALAFDKHSTSTGAARADPGPLSAPPALGVVDDTAPVPTCTKFIEIPSDECTRGPCARRRSAASRSPLPTRSIPLGRLPAADAPRFPKALAVPCAALGSLFARPATDVRPERGLTSERAVAPACSATPECARCVLKRPTQPRALARIAPVSRARCDRLIRHARPRDAPPKCSGRSLAALPRNGNGRSRQIAWARRGQGRATTASPARANPAAAGERCSRRSQLPKNERPSPRPSERVARTRNRARPYAVDSTTRPSTSQRSEARARPET